jgi:hypothetical protein
MLAVEEALNDLPMTLLAAEEPPPAAIDAKHRQAVIISDWHAGEVVDPAQVGGLNEFDWDVLERRVSTAL